MNSGLHISQRATNFCAPAFKTRKQLNWIDVRETGVVRVPGRSSSTCVTRGGGRPSLYTFTDRDTSQQQGGVGTAKLYPLKYNRRE